MTGLDQRIVVAPEDASLGPLLRVADDRLAPGAAYGLHEHRAVDVVAVVLSGSLVHEWTDRTSLRAGDVAVLRAGSGLRHDERAGPDGARVLQCYLRGAEPSAEPSHGVAARATGWVELARPDARLWIGRGVALAPPGLVLEVGDDDVRPTLRAAASRVGGRVVVWELDVRRPHWAS